MRYLAKLLAAVVVLAGTSQIAGAATVQYVFNAGPFSAAGVGMSGLFVVTQLSAPTDAELFQSLLFYNPGSSFVPGDDGDAKGPVTAAVPTGPLTLKSARFWGGGFDRYDEIYFLLENAERTREYGVSFYFPKFALSNNGSYSSVSYHSAPLGAMLNVSSVEDPAPPTDPTPEPSAILLGGAGLGVLAWKRWRK